MFNECIISGDGVCDGKTCTRNAECVNYNCVCKRGYLGNGYESCAGMLNIKI